jgi:DNA polymerase delta subunit 1
MHTHAHTSQVPMLRLYGVTEDGHSCLVHVHGYEPYFYVQAPPGMTVSIDP